MKITYDAKHDILRILLSDARILESEEPAPGFILDYSAEGSLVGLEILDASRSVPDPRAVEFVELAA